MKPGDHPEFFRFPAPAGRSRESTIVLDGEGRFWHDGALVAHPPMALAFAQWLGRHPDDGRFILSNGYDWTYVTVEDAPYFVRGVEERDGHPWLSLSDDSREPLSPRGLRVGRGGALYCLVKEGAFEARFTPEAQTKLAPWLTEDEAGRSALRLPGQLVHLPE